MAGVQVGALYQVLPVTAPVMDGEVKCRGAWAFERWVDALSHLLSANWLRVSENFALTCCLGSHLLVLEDVND